MTWVLGSISLRIAASSPTPTMWPCHSATACAMDLSGAKSKDIPSSFAGGMRLAQLRIAFSLEPGARFCYRIAAFVIGILRRYEPTLVSYNNPDHLIGRIGPEASTRLWASTRRGAEIARAPGQNRHIRSTGKRITGGSVHPAGIAKRGH